jgi:hypothetical protein
MSGSKRRESAEKLGQEQTHIGNVARWRSQDHNGKGQGRKLLLPGKVFVHRQKHVELAGSGDKPEQVAVLDP